MPAKSKAQERLMQMVAHSKDMAAKTGISQKVAKKFVKDSPKYSSMPETVKKKGK